MTPKDYFSSQPHPYKKRYDALHAFFNQGHSAKQCAEKFGYSLSAFYSLTRDFHKHLKEKPNEDFFFKRISLGRKPAKINQLTEMIIELRENNHSAEDIVGIVNAKDHPVSYGYVYNLLNKQGFARLPRRSQEEKMNLTPRIVAPISKQLKITGESFHSHSTGVLAFIPLIKKYQLDHIIEKSLYPQTKSINKLSSILSFLALKISNVKRYSKDDIWCMDRGLGLLAGLNVLPKAAWLSSYSSRVTKAMNLSFLRALHKVWQENEMLCDTANLDFTTIPYWGDHAHLENNWSGKRNKALPGMLAVLAQDPDTGIIDYANSDVMHQNQSKVVLEYLDFYRSDNKTCTLKYLVFDSKFTNYENLSRLDDDQIKFITIRRRGKNIMESVKNRRDFKTIRVEAAGLKKRSIKILDENISLKGYGDKKQLKTIRQITITGHGKIKPALIITNDFQIATEHIVRKYSQRWLVEKGISEQIDFFHLNKVSSSMVIKVDFDLTMSILAHNLYRLFAKELGRYSHFSDERIYNKFIANNGMVRIGKDTIDVELKKKRELPKLIEVLEKMPQSKCQWLGALKLNFIPSATS